MSRIFARPVGLAAAALLIPACGFRMAEPPPTERFPEALLGTFIQRGGANYTEYLHFVRKEDDAQVLVTRVFEGLDGARTWTAMARKVKGRDVLLVAVTGWGQEEERQKSSAAGFNVHMVKPVDHDALERLLASMP